jgi:hypothetical protein
LICFNGAGLDRNEKLREIGSRNFFMCPKNSIGESENGGDGSVTASFGSCSTQAEKPCKGFGWLSKVYSFLL